MNIQSTSFVPTPHFGQNNEKNTPNDIRALKKKKEEKRKEERNKIRRAR